MTSLLSIPGGRFSSPKLDRGDGIGAKPRRPVVAPRIVGISLPRLERAGIRDPFELALRRISGGHVNDAGCVSFWRDLNKANGV